MHHSIYTEAWLLQSKRLAGKELSNPLIADDLLKIIMVYQISRPITHLLEKDTPFVFSQDCINAFETLKKKLTEAPILVVPDWNLPFELMCDASDFAIGAVLGQRKTKHFQPIHYASKTMTEAQIHYTTTEKEMLAVVYAFEKFRPYLVLSKSIVYTDHSALKYLMNKQDAKPREKLVISKALISSLSSNATLDLVKAQREWKFVLATHSEEAQGVSTRIATLAIRVSSDLI
ncbi:reverse transcriptase domain-containing protein [Tanacetum coccineum]